MRFLLSAIIVFCGNLFGQIKKGDLAEVRNYIAQNWNGTVEYQKEDSGALFGLPRPYTVPSAKGEKHFKELYYWDTYFTNVGLLRDGRVDLAVNNTDNILYMVQRFGKMLNGSHTRYLNRSQPPFLSMMVTDVFEYTHDKVWLRAAVDVLETEYRFWTTERLTWCGLSHYGSSANDEEKMAIAKIVKQRFADPHLLDSLSPAQILDLGAHYTAECESGWDFTPRYGGLCLNYCPIDLNCNLYAYEINFSRFYGILGEKEKALAWEAKAQARKVLMNKYCLDSASGIYYDYDYVNQKRSEFLSAGSFYPYFTNLAERNSAQALKYILRKLEAKYGVRACIKANYSRPYQWGDANCWAPLQFIAYRSLVQYQLKKPARRVKNKYLTLVALNYKKTQHLWEKYNADNGNIKAVNEYEMPAFLGWTAGVFVYFDSTK